MRRSIEVGEVIDASRFATLGAMYKVFPGIVRSYTAAIAGKSPALVDVEPGVHDVRIDTETGERSSEPFGIIPAVPVGVLRFGPFVVAGALEVGGHVTLLSYDLDPTKHRGTGNAEDPTFARRHGGNFWLVLPIDICNPSALADPGSQLFMGTPGGVGVAIDGSTVSLGSAAPSDAVALASVLDSFINVFLQAWTPVATDGGLALKTALVAWALTASPKHTPFQSTASGTVKCDP